MLEQGGKALQYSLLKELFQFSFLSLSLFLCVSILSYKFQCRFLSEMKWFIIHKEFLFVKVLCRVSIGKQSGGGAPLISL